MTGWETMRLEAAIGYGPDDPAPQWTDLTPWLDTTIQPVVITQGRPTEMPAGEPSTMTFALNNSDHRFTDGNTLSPYWPNWHQSVKVRYSETIGNVTFRTFTGWIEAPEIQDWAQISPIVWDQVIVVTAVDRLTRVDRSHTYVSTLAEHIALAGGTSLVKYLPLGDASFAASASLSAVAASGDSIGVFLIKSSSDGTAAFTPAGGSPLPGDDLPRPVWNPQINAAGVGVDSDAYVYATFATPITITTGQTLTIVGWMKVTEPNDLANFVFDLFDQAAVYEMSLRRTVLAETPPGVWKLLVRQSPAVWDTTLYGPPWSVGTDTMFVAQFTLAATPTLTLWVDGVKSTAAILTGTPGASVSFSRLLIGGSGFVGNISHFQIYVGPYTDAMATAQRAMGHDGLAGQYTGERITTLLRYAGVPATELAGIDRGMSRMAKAELAGASPLTKLQEAVDTEQGRLRADGQGFPIFDDRSRRYNR
jgi:hypothetical protein